MDAYARTRVVESFNATLGLPRQRDTALIAGSVAWIRLLAPPEDWRTRIAQLEARGIGLRRNEGYGRVAFNHPIYERREELTRSAIRLDTAMRLGVGAGKDMFARQWEDELDKHLPTTKRLDPRFAAVARWLHTHRAESPEALRGRLDTIGQPDSALIEALGGTTGYGARNKANFFQTDGKSVMEALGGALTWLQRENPENWPRGIERLASWVAALAVDKQGGTQ
ncbi:MAG: hypothetical protein BWY63_02976 [Chloroflexi bacterium ADurb.Bin360]|nr:MAG: hypothetical protein BWY63_02976 [Chloroflexi bacterium ADurb.Bin360]